jgi:hypothetical protein
MCYVHQSMQFVGLWIKTGWTGRGGPQQHMSMDDPLSLLIVLLISYTIQHISSAIKTYQLKLAK